MFGCVYLVLGVGCFRFLFVVVFVGVFVGVFGVVSVVCGVCVV